MDLNFHQCLIIYIVLFMISLIFFLTRCYVRVKINKEMHAEDWFAVAAIVLMFIETVLSVLFTKDFLLVMDLPKLLTMIETTEFPQFLKHILQIQIGSYVTFMTSLYCIKFSFLFFYKRIAAGMKLSKFWVLTLVICILAYIGNFVGFFFSCIPFSTYFDASCNTTQRSRNNASLYGFTSTDILTDVLIMIIPIRLLGHLRVSRNQKIGLAFLFSLGFTVVAMSIVRTLRIEAGNANPTLDPKWVAVWSMAEQTTAMVVNCLPAIRKLFSVEAEKHCLKFTPKAFNPTSFPKWSFLTRHSNDSAEKNQIHKETQVNFGDAVLPIGTVLKSPSDLEACVPLPTASPSRPHRSPELPPQTLPGKATSSKKVSPQGHKAQVFVSKMPGPSGLQKDLESQMDSTEEFLNHGEAMIQERTQSIATGSTSEITKSI